MSSQQLKKANPPDNITPQDIEREIQAFIQKLIEINRKLHGKNLEEKMKLEEELDER